MAGNNLEHMVYQRKDIREIRNLMSRYSYLQWAALYDDIAELFSKSPDVKAEISDWGVYEGKQGINRLYNGLHKYLDGDRLGVMNLHTLTSPLIEVAEDGKTAKGVWVSPGIESHKIDSRHQGYWSWWRYGVDFIKEDNIWKIWHLHVYGIFRIHYETSWVDFIPETINIPDMYKADRPSTYHWMWSPGRALENVPEIPEPYEKWRESKAYVK